METSYLNMIDSGEKLSERELRDFVFSYEIDRDEGEGRRWTKTNVSYCQLGERFFSVVWEEGLTECQENEFYYQPVEVKRVISEVIIPEHKETITEWVKI